MLTTSLRRVAILLALGLSASIWISAQQKNPSGEWPSYGGTNWSQKYSALDQITPENFKNLQIAWT